MPRIISGDVTEDFDADEWIVVRYCYATVGHTGPGSQLVLGGEMSAQGFVDTQSMLRRVHEGVATRRLNANIQHGQGAASSLLFQRIKSWKYPYVKDYDSGSVVMQGTKRLGKVDDDPSLPSLVPLLGQLPVFARAVNKLDALFPQGKEPCRVSIEL